MDQNELNKVLKKHSMWRNGEPGGEQANLYRADLSGANLTNADLTNADLFDADLSDANLSYADLSDANLSYADLFDANLSYANLSYANLSGADLTGADLTDANLIGANLIGTNLTNADLTNAKLPKFQICPEVGQFHAWKKVMGGLVLELLVSGERTSSLVGRKCRCSKAKVLRAFDWNEEITENRVYHSIHNRDFVYEVGKWVKEPNYNPDIRLECTSGIHFFMTREEAEAF